MNEPPLTAAGPIIRRAVLADAALLGAMRAAQQAEIDGIAPAGTTAYARACTDFFARELAAAEPWILGWIATDEAGWALGAAVLTLAPAMPRLGSIRTGPDGRIRNVYVRPEARRRGVARELVRAAIAASEGLGVDRLMLGASAAGRPLYEALGFVDKRDEMVFRPSKDEPVNRP